MKYFDKNGTEISAGMHLRMEDGKIEKVYATTDANGEPDLGISATNEAFLVRHPEWTREYYSLSSFQSRLKNIEIVNTQEGELVCGCGNNTLLDGFFPCDEKGNEIEPTINSNWNGLYVCAKCGQIHKMGDKE